MSEVNNSYLFELLSTYPIEEDINNLINKCSKIIKTNINIYWDDWEPIIKIRKKDTKNDVIKSWNNENTIKFLNNIYHIIGPTRSESYHRPSPPVPDGRQGEEPPTWDRSVLRRTLAAGGGSLRSGVQVRPGLGRGRRKGRRPTEKGNVRATPAELSPDTPAGWAATGRSRPGSPRSPRCRSFLEWLCLPQHHTVAAGPRMPPGRRRNRRE